jgi:hypothetical protein
MHGDGPHEMLTRLSAQDLGAGSSGAESASFSINDSGQNIIIQGNPRTSIA